MNPKGKKTGKGRRNAAAQRVDEAFAEIRELRAWVHKLLDEVNRLDAKLGSVDARTLPMQVIGGPWRGTPIPPGEVVDVKDIKAEDRP